MLNGFSKLKELKKTVLKANLELPLRGLVTFSWGNVSGIDRNKALVVIKPSGIPYEDLKIAHLVVVDLEGKVIYGKLKPSSDTQTHLEIYKRFPQVGGVVHTHSRWATIWAQAGKSIPALGTTHADYFYGGIPCTKNMKRDEIVDDYEKNTGDVIVKAFRNLDPRNIPGVLVSSHGPFCWGENAMDALHNAVILEEIALMAYHTIMIKPDVKKMSQVLLDKHFLRKHGKDSYYGQNS
jgi:L-ribulose-5-phosphate 4-epimerase